MSLLLSVDVFDKHTAMIKSCIYFGRVYYGKTEIRTSSFLYI